MTSPEPTQETRGKGALGLGAILIFVAKFISNVSGYVIYIFLANRLGADLGDWDTVTRATNLFNMVMITGTVQAVAKFVSERPEDAHAVRDAAFRGQLLLSGATAAFFFAAAPRLAQWQQAPALVDLYRLAALILVAYSFYAISIGVINGRKLFLWQGSFDIAYSVLRMGLILGAVQLGYGVYGAIGAWVAASALIFLASLAVVGMPRFAGTFPVSRFFKFIVPIMIFTFLLNLLMALDSYVLRSLAEGEAEARELAAVMGAVGKAANIPYLVVVSVTFILFPMVSRVTHVGDVEKTADYIRQGLRWTLFFAGGFAALLCACAPAMLRLMYNNPDLWAGAAGLSILSAGYLFFALGVVASTIITGGGYPGRAMVIVLIAVAADIAANYLLIPRWGLNGACVASALAMLLWAVLCLRWVYARYGAGLPLRHAWRLCAGMAAVAVVGLVFMAEPVSKADTLRNFALLGLVYLGALAAVGELGRREASHFLQLLRHRR